jgi:hypothetical protein
MTAPHAVIALVGNKTDRVALPGCRSVERTVSTEEIALFSKDEDVAFAETSAKTGDNVRTIWQELGRRLLNQPEQGGVDTALFLDPSWYETALCSDAHESSILAEVLGLASIFLPRNRLALLEPYSINSPSPATHFPLCHGFLRPSTPLASPREAAALPEDPRLASCSTRRLVCITGSMSWGHG